MAVWVREVGTKGVGQYHKVGFCRNNNSSWDSEVRINIPRQKGSAQRRNFPFDAQKLHFNTMNPIAESVIFSWPLGPFN